MASLNVDKSVEFTVEVDTEDGNIIVWVCNVETGDEATILSINSEGLVEFLEHEVENVGLTLA